MKLSILTIITGIILLSACSDPKPPRIVYPKDSTQIVGKITPKEDSTIILVGQLPIFYDSTDVLIFPVGEIKLTSRNKSFLSSGKNFKGSYGGSYLNGDSYQGNLRNLYFQKADQEEVKPLTNDYIHIKGFTYLKKIKKALGKDLLVMRIADSDTNQDGVINHQDLESLYVVNLDGTNFMKVSPAYQELIDWKLIELNNRIYFRTLEDTDKNGLFDNKDKFHHYFVSLQNDVPKIVEYSLGQ